MGNNPVNGVDPDGGLFELGAVGSTLAEAGIGAAVGAGVGLLTDEDHWGWYAAGGALAGATAGYLTRARPKIPVASPRYSHNSSPGVGGRPTVTKTTGSVKSGSICVGEPLQQVGGELVPYSEVSPAAEIQYSWSPQTYYKPKFSVPIDVGGSVLNGVTNGLRYMKLYETGRLSLDEQARWSGSGLRIGDVFDFDAIANSPGWRPLGGIVSYGGAYYFNQEGVEISLQNETILPINSISIDEARRRIDINVHNTGGGNFRYVGYIQFSKYREADFNRLKNILLE